MSCTWSLTCSLSDVSETLDHREFPRLPEGVPETIVSICRWHQQSSCQDYHLWHFQAYGHCRWTYEPADCWFIRHSTVFRLILSAPCGKHPSSIHLAFGGSLPWHILAVKLHMDMQNSILICMWFACSGARSSASATGPTVVARCAC